MLRPQNYTTGAGSFNSNPPMVNGFMKQNSNVTNNEATILPQNSFVSENVNMMGGVRNQIQV
jgi:hypothetical protein